MRNHFILGLFLLMITPATFAANDPLPDADTVITKMLVQDGQRNSLRGGYRGMRRYMLENKKLHQHAEMTVSVECVAEGTKQFRVIAEKGWKPAQKQVLEKMLDAESDASSPKMLVRTRISSDNYEFQMVSKELLDGRMAYAIDIIPKRREERLFQGRIWIDAKDFALVRAEGKPAKSPSFWTRSVHFIQTYRKSGSFWFPTSTESIAEMRIFGPTSVNIEYFDYSPTPVEAADAKLREAIPK
jgi:hypothetical protein